MKRLLRIILLTSLLLICSACREQIIHDLSEAEANRVLSGLHQIKIDSEKKKQSDGRWCVTVAKTDTIRAISYISDSRILPEVSSGFESKPSMISSREDQRFRFERALSREIEHTLASIDGILEARVHLNLPPRDPLFGELIKNGGKGSASVLLITDQSKELDDGQIRQLVSGAAGVNTESISVLISESVAERVLKISLIENVAATSVPVLEATEGSRQSALEPQKTFYQLVSLLNNFWFQIFLSIAILTAGLSFSFLNGWLRKRKKLAAIAEQFQTRELRDEVQNDYS